MTKAPRRNRDDFSTAVIRLLRERVGGMCSKPDCSVLTHGASAQKDKVSNVGVAAHISAAAPLGPRYDKNMSAEQRKSIDNAIWLCQTCSKLIDTDTVTYSVSLLHAWKMRAERRSNANVGKKYFSEDDVSSKVLEGVIKGIGGFNKNNMSLNIMDVVKKQEQSLEALDPRFNVSTTLLDGKFSHRIGIKDGLNASMRMIIEDNALEGKFESLLDYARPVEFDASNIKFVDSALFDHIISDLGSAKGVLKISPVEKLVDIQICVEFENTVVDICSMNGKLVTGTKSSEIKASGLGGLIQASYLLALDGDQPHKFSFRIDMSKWHGNNVRSLSYFPRFERAMHLLKRGGKLVSEINYQGRSVVLGRGAYVSNEDGWDWFISAMTYISMCKKISELSGVSVLFDEFSHTDKEWLDLAEAIELYEGEIVVDGSKLINPMRMKMILNEGGNVTDLDGVQGNVMIVENDPWTIKVMGKYISLPGRCIKFENATVHVNVESVNQISNEVDASLTMNPGNRIIKSYKLS